MSSRRNTFMFMTPAVARIAYEQTAAWYMTEINKNVATPPPAFQYRNAARYRYILEQAGVELRHMVLAGYVRHVDNHADVIEIDMQKLYAAAQAAPPKPAEPGMALTAAHVPRPRRQLKLQPR